MAEAAEQDTPPPAKKSGGIMGMLVSGIGIFVLTLGAVIAGGFINAKLHPTPDYKLDKDGHMTAVAGGSGGGHAEEAGAKPSVFYAIDPPLVVNFEDGSVVKFLQISMSLMVHGDKAVESLQKNAPLIRNNLLLLMSNRDYKTLMSRDGKEKLRQEALTEIRAVQKKQDGADVDDVLFTSFVVQ